MKKFLTFIGCIISIASVIGVAYFGFIFMFVGGIIQVVDALKAVPVVSSDVAWGVARVVFTGLGTMILAFASLFANIAMWTAISDLGRANKKRPYSSRFL